MPPAPRHPRHPRTECPLPLHFLLHRAGRRPAGGRGNRGREAAKTKRGGREAAKLLYNTALHRLPLKAEAHEAAKPKCKRREAAKLQLVGHEAALPAL